MGAKRSAPCGISSRFCGFRLSLAGFCWWTCRHRCLSSAFGTAFGPLGPEDLSWRKILLSGVQRCPAPLKPPGGCCGILIFSGLAAILGGLEFAYLLYLMCFAGESPATPHTYWLSCVRPSLQNGSGKLWYTSATTATHSAAASKPLLRKIMFKLQRWLANCPTHTNQYFPGLLQ